MVADPASNKLDFAGMNAAYNKFFGTATQPNKPARTTVQVAALVNAGPLLEIRGAGGAEQIGHGQGSGIRDQGSGSGTAELKRRGHVLQTTDSQGVSQIILVNEKEGLLEGGTDHRAPEAVGRRPTVISH